MLQESKSESFSCFHLCSFDGRGGNPNASKSTWTQQTPRAVGGVDLGGRRSREKGPISVGGGGGGWRCSTTQSCVEGHLGPFSVPSHSVLGKMAVSLIHGEERHSQIAQPSSPKRKK